MSSSGSDDDGGPKLPNDVAVEILKRLPARSLFRFRCVCRSWRSTIDDSRFVALHWSHSALDTSSRYLVCLDLGDDAVQSPCSLFPNDDRYGFVGSCNGLICVAKSSGDGIERAVYLWNLFTRKHKAGRLYGPEEQQFLSMARGRVLLGFYFDASDYHLVRILHFPGVRRWSFWNRKRRDRKPRVKIYSLSTDSWRTVECEVPALSYSNRAVFLNVNLHWYAFDRKGVFDEMALPGEMFHTESTDSLHSVLSVAVLNDLLAVFFSGGQGAGHSDLNTVCSVWVMRDYGMSESWTKLYTFETHGVITGFDGFTWNGELLIEINCEERVSWNPIPLSTSCELVPVVESLFSL
ncbi:hypothetical protein ACJRO7_033820 [Eucalyptus globulus]|uniref:F-box domain-containing protein n=1 Tax=Eucalyptus globulus TaxID=34317 RepID=A0ABD3J4V0_EUCGL